MSEMVATKENSKPQRRRAASLDRRKANAGYFFVLPFIFGFIAVYLPLVYESLMFSFHSMKTGGVGGYTLTAVGFDNYTSAFLGRYGSQFQETLLSGIKQLCFDIPAIVIFSLFVAVILNQKMVGRAAFRAIFFIPVILSTGLIESLDQANTLLSDLESSGIDTGTASSASTEIISMLDVESLFQNMKVGKELVEYVVAIVNNIYDIINRSGVQMLIFLAGLQSISPAIYESCQIEGASAWETFWKITFPMISPMILVNAIYTIIDSFTSGSNKVMSFISVVYSTTDGQTLSAAMSWIYFAIVIGIIAVVAGVISMFVFYQRRD
jgi:ABC-type sugar transport system permease subunit